MLARFTLGMISTEAMKAIKFQKGLRVEIRHALAGARISSCFIMVQRAHAIEEDMAELHSDQTLQRVMRSSQGSSSSGKKRSGWHVKLRVR